MKFYHYSENNIPFDSSKIHKIENISYSATNKPKHGTGFWGSPCDSRNEWGNFCVKNHLYIEGLLYRMEFEVDFKTSNILEIKGPNDLNKIYNFLLPRHPTYNNIFLDWETIASKYDAFFLEIKPLEEISLSDSYINYWKFFPNWDVDSILVFNPKVIKNVTSPVYMACYNNLTSITIDTEYDLKLKKFKAHLGLA